MKQDGLEKVIIYWARRDFRICDNPALCAALENSQDRYFLPVFVLEDYILEAQPQFQFGWPSRFFLSQAIPEFAKNFDNFLLVSGKGAQTFIDLQKNFDIEIYVNEDIYIDFYKQIEKLKKHNIPVKVFEDQLTVSKETVSGTGSKYSVFTPFKKSVWNEFLQKPVLEKANPKNAQYLPKDILEKIPNQIKIDQDIILNAFSQNRTFETLDYKTNKKHKFDIDTLLDFRPDLETWYFTEEQAQKKLEAFIDDLLLDYKESRDSLEKDKTSKLSVALAWGLLSARQIRKAIQDTYKESFVDVDWFSEDTKTGKLAGVYSFLSELVWREFYKYLLFHNPKLMNEEFQEKFRFTVDWVEESIALKRFEAWIKGETGYAIVDAAMMQLAKTGWMHNRSRMIVASVLTKNLGVDWRWGQEYFRAMLIDLDEASNNGGWQWGASVGADPKPIRIFNPYLQAENYDKQNIYQKKWLSDEKFFFGPPPLVEHKDARAEALKRYGLEKVKQESVRDY